MPETLGSFWRDGAAQRRACHGKAFPRPLIPGSCAWRRAGHAIWAEAFDAYRSLAGVGRAFRNAKGDLRIRPVHVYSEDHVRAHVFLCMLALHVEWHMRRRLAPILSGDDDRGGARAQRNSPVEPAKVSERAETKAARRCTPDGLPVHSLATLLADLGTLTLNEVTLPGAPDHAFPLLATPTELQRRAFGLLDIDPARDVAM